MELVFAGFGGQGVLTSGMIMAEMALEEGKTVTWMPTYGPAMRGGKAYSVVKYVDGVIGGPDIEESDVLVAMNAAYLKEGGTLIINSDEVADDQTVEGNFNIIRVPCMELAMKANNPKAANIVAIGALIKKCGLFEPDMARRVLKEMFVKKGKEKFTAANEAAFNEGYNYVQ
mgnify:FL=1